MISRQDLLKAIEAARSKGYTVLAPVRQDGIPLLARVDEADSIDFEHVLTVNTLKDMLLPRCEPVASLDLDQASVVSVREDERPILVFGSRPCDAAAMAIMDSILLGSVRDARYAGRREKTIIMTIACSKCDDACFCTSMGYGPHDPTGSDILIVPSRDRFLVRHVSAKGKTFLEDIGLSEDVGGTNEGEGRGKGGSKGEGDAEDKGVPVLKRTVDTSRLKAWLDSNFDSPLWHEVSENCVSCGTCYYLCPTCHCFDITDETGLSKGERMRIWDCCSFPNFTKMASHQPRVGRHTRYRQRVMHKFAYCPDNVGKVACVGDGRCIRHCPYGVDICEVLGKLVGKK